MDKISLEDVKKLAKLARLGLTEEEMTKLAPQMSEILNFAEKLNEVNIAEVKPTSQVTGLKNVFREDCVKASAATREELLNNAPNAENGFIKVKSVL